MWITVLVMAIALSFEPVRISLTVMMLNSPRPALQLVTFLCGGFAMGVSVGLVVLFVLRHTLPATTNFTVPKVQILIGVLALLVAAVLATNIPARQFTRGRLAGAAVGGDGVTVVEPTPPSALEKLSTRTRHLLQGSSIWVPGVLGLAVGLPTGNYMAAVAVVLASGAAPAAQTGALFAFNVVAFAPVEIPLMSYLAAPGRTSAFMAALHDWTRSRPRRNVAALMAAVGCFMLALGMSAA
ncbi:MAG: GAP family protein [Mycobacterium sp.]